ncbi:MAG: GTPase HflX [Candidatus Actinomarina sp.]|nr:GTPase HflX [Candidatus Actinomarina sp.]MDA2946553.1 GTPase HflX [Actinomycetota bacterium]MBL6762467.1 GTPase HflX [Candidatus Actinomarina sp.]MBL6835758.1 GTPase HflX [Candidatus Actinomarina sp.]MDA3008936.1 GTPase HflX [Actinomycetota bacterium]
MNQRNNPNQSDRRLLTVSDRDIFVTTQKALLIGIVLKNEIRADKEESLKELVNLVKTAGSSPTIIQTKRVEKIDPKTFIGKGSIKELVDISDANDIDVVLFDCELTPNQQKELRALFKCDVVDRTGLILDIFALHAQSKEASLQVELALSIYLKPRLAGLGKTLNQQGGGIGTRGPGETKLETDNRLIDNRINKLKREIKKVSKQREVQSSFRKKNNTPLVSIVGYTNAGKSTMLEKITSSKTYVANELFATVDSLQRELKIDGINEHIILSDTVGFIQNLPTTLIESFKSTLTVVKEANLLIHVVDAASAIPEMHINTVHEILDQIEADVPEILVFNKIDRIDKASLNYLTEKYPDAIFVSSTKGTNIEKLISEITTNVFGDLNEVSLIISPKDLDQLHKYSSIVSVKNIEEGLEVIVEIRNYYLENLLQKDVVKLLS